jgi:hypothetical protein
MMVTAKLSLHLIFRALRILKCVSQGKPIPLPKSMYPMDEYLEIGEEFLSLDFDSQDIQEKMINIIQKIKKSGN